MNQKLKLHTQKPKEDNTWINVFRKNQNITELTREILGDLIDVIYIHEGGDITVVFKYENEYKQALKFIKDNKEYCEQLKGNKVFEDMVNKIAI